MLVALFISAAIAFFALGIGMIVGRRSFARNVPQGSGLPTTPGRVVALGCFALAAAITFVVLTTVNLVSLSRQGNGVSSSLHSPATGTRTLGIVMIVVALSLAFGAGLITFSIRRARTTAQGAGQSLRVRQRLLYAVASVAAGASIALIAAGLSIAWFS